MIETIQHFEQGFVLYILVVARLLPIAWLVPFFGGRQVTGTARVGITLALSMLIFPALLGTKQPIPTQTLTLVFFVAKELLLGLTFGFITALIFEAVRMAGQLMDTFRGQQPGLTTFEGARLGVLGNTFEQLTIVMFLLIGGHHLFLTALLHSFATLPVHVFPTTAGLSSDLIWLIMRLGADSITLGVLLAFPIIAATILVDLCLALTAKISPQVQIFFMGMSLKAMMGLFVFLLALNILLTRAVDEVIGSIGYIDAITTLLVGNR